MNEPKLVILAGPSGSGKTTITEHLINNFNYICPVHTTTRQVRDDDTKGFYEHISQEEFFEHEKTGEISTSNKGNKRWYAIRETNLSSAFEKKPAGLILNVGLNELEYYRKKFPNAHIIVTAFKDIPNTIYKRNMGRNISEANVLERTNSALIKSRKYEESVGTNATIRLYTDDIDIAEMLEYVEKVLTSDVYKKLTIQKN